LLVDFFLAFVPPRPDFNNRNIDDRTRNKDNRFATRGSGVKGGMKRLKFVVPSRHKVCGDIR
jgi:hypothetical protein